MFLIVPPIQYTETLRLHTWRPRVNNPVSPEPFVSSAKAPPVKRSEKGYGNESEFQLEWAQSTCSVMRAFTVMSLLGVLQNTTFGLAYGVLGLNATCFWLSRYILGLHLKNIWRKLLCPPLIGIILGWKSFPPPVPLVFGARFVLCDFFCDWLDWLIWFSTLRWQLIYLPLFTLNGNQNIKPRCS